MPKFIKKCLKWLLCLFLLGVALLVVLFLSKDTILRLLIQQNIKRQTGMTAEIGQFHLGLSEPVVTITIKDLKLHNPPGFGDAPFLDIPEIHAEFDRAAFATNDLHLTLLRFNLGELDIVKNAAGRTNLFELGVTVPTKQSVTNNQGLTELKQKTGFQFTGIDLLTVSVGTAKFIDQQDPKNSRAETIGLENISLHDVKSETDLLGLMALVTLRGSDVFGALAEPNGTDSQSQLLKLLF